MHTIKLLAALVGAAIVTGCVEYPGANDPATAAAYAAWKECTRKQAVSMAYVNDKPGAIAAEAIGNCWKEENAFKAKAGMAEQSSHMNQLKSIQSWQLSRMVQDLRARRKHQ
jgi:hypothetical protein